MKIYFSWLKTFNHLYKDIDFDPNLIENFVNECTEITRELEENTKEISSPNHSTSEADGSFEISDDEDFSPFKESNIEIHQPLISDGKQDYASMFFNKYCEDPNLPTVYNHFAEIVVDYETNRNIFINETDDFDMDDEEEIKIGMRNPGNNKRKDESKD